jgi:fructokinase
MKQFQGKSLKLSKPRILGIGELLWDVFPDEKRPGGAPANVIYHVSLLGAAGCLVSRVGDDQPGREIVAYLEKKGVDISNIQIDKKWPTGQVNISFTGSGEPDYTIVKPAAWDFIEFSPGLADLLKNCDAIIFGTLAQRNDVSGNTIQRVLKGSNRETLKVLDVNFRREGYNTAILKNSLKFADIVKINEDELNEIGRLTSAKDPIRWMLREFDIQGICLTKGVEGSTWYDRGNSFSQKAYRSSSNEGDPVGLGDGFTAVLTLELLKHNTPSEALERASRYTSLLSEKKGGMPEIQKTELSDIFPVEK